MGHVRVQHRTIMITLASLALTLAPSPPAHTERANKQRGHEKIHGLQPFYRQPHKKKTGNHPMPTAQQTWISEPPTRSVSTGKYLIPRYSKYTSRKYPKGPEKLRIYHLTMVEHSGKYRVAQSFQLSGICHQQTKKKSQKKQNTKRLGTNSLICSVIGRVLCSHMSSTPPHSPPQPRENQGTVTASR